MKKIHVVVTLDAVDVWGNTLEIDLLEAFHSSRSVEIELTRMPCVREDIWIERGGSIGLQSDLTLQVLQVCHVANDLLNSDPSGYAGYIKARVIKYNRLQPSGS